MMLPGWLAGLTGASKFGGPQGANLGDMFQAAGHSMAQHARGQGGTFGAFTDAPEAGRAVGKLQPPLVLPGLPPEQPILGQPLPPAAAAIPTRAPGSVPHGLATGPYWGQRPLPGGRMQVY